MFDKILIANRGEIACRIIRTARRMGIATVAVYSRADARAGHVKQADEAICIGPPDAARSYLDIGRIIRACQDTGAQAVHPGYGFLSENPRFVHDLEEAGIAFIGPNARAVAAMGDKATSKDYARRAGVSTVPGHDGIMENPDMAREAAQTIGYPVMIKAAAGGGGKGMRVVQSPDELEEAFARTASEALNAFGDDRLLIEAYITDPRHIEIQVLGDKHGNVIHLGERECSLQRRNQKVVEEAPSPLLDEETRQAMAGQAVALARAVGYDSAGTVEFIVTQDQKFYFLEMNTRLQVEHPVTELITGVDLVEMMIRAAAGQKLPLKQADVRTTGWAVECRVFAEDPVRNFAPSTGVLFNYRPPAEDNSIRHDGGFCEGGEISPHYDPMIAKLCSYGPDRATAITAMTHALDSYVIDGIRHNLPFLAAVMSNQRWREGRLSTGFIEQEFPQGFQGARLDATLLDRLTCVVAVLSHRQRLRLLAGPAAGEAQVASYDISLDDGPDETRWLTLDIRQDAGGVATVIDENGVTRRIEAQWQPEQVLCQAQIDGDELTFQLRPALNAFHLSCRGAEIVITPYARHCGKAARLMPPRATIDLSARLVCPMPGLVVAVNVAPGQKVVAGETLVIVESMKMENALTAPRDCVIGEIHVRQGDRISADAILMEFVKEGEE